MRLHTAMALVALLSACANDAVSRLPYEGCVPGDNCSFGTVCTRAARSATGTGQGYQCSVTTCRVDDDCPSLDGACVLNPPDSTGQCVRRCTYGCRAGTACTPTPEYGPLCLPIGPDGPRASAYQRCPSAGAACRDGTVCMGSLTPTYEASNTCTHEGCSGDQDCPDYSLVEVACRELLSPTGLTHRCAHTCRTNTDCARYGTVCVNRVCE